MNPEYSQPPVKLLTFLVVLLMIGAGYLAVEYQKSNVLLEKLTHDYQILVSTDVAHVPPSDFQILMLTPPELLEDAFRSIVVVRGEVAAISETSLTLHAKLVDMEMVRGIFSGKIEHDFAKRPHPETLKTLTIEITPQTSYLLADNPPRVGDQIQVVTYEPVLLSEILTAKYIYPSVAGLSN